MWEVEMWEEMCNAARCCTEVGCKFVVLVSVSYSRR